MTAFDSQSAVFYGHVMVVGPACLLLPTFVVNVPIFAASSELGAWKVLTLHRKVLRLRRNSATSGRHCLRMLLLCSFLCFSHVCRHSVLWVATYQPFGSHCENVLLPTGRTLTGF